MHKVAFIFLSESIRMWASFLIFAMLEQGKSLLEKYRSYVGAKLGTFIK